MKTIRVIIPSRMAGDRLDAALSVMLPNSSRSRITSLIKSNDALINKQSFKPKDRVKGNEVVTLQLRQKQTHNWTPENIPLDIVFEDEDIIIINKSVGLITHPGAGNWSGTLANALLNHDKNLSKLDRAGIVHR